MRISGKHYVTGEQVNISIADGRIASVVAEATEVEAGAQPVWIAPGFCDLQINGYGGYDFNIDAWGGANEVANDLDPLFALAARAGTALLCPTITTNSGEAIGRALGNLARKLTEDRRLDRAVPGIHLEGPYISTEDGPRGAHPLEHVRDPDWGRILPVSGGRCWPHQDLYIGTGAPGGVAVYRTLDRRGRDGRARPYRRNPRNHSATPCAPARGYPRTWATGRIAASPPSQLHLGATGGR